MMFSWRTSHPEKKDMLFEKQAIIKKAKGYEQVQTR